MVLLPPSLILIQILIWYVSFLFKKKGVKICKYVCGICSGVSPAFKKWKTDVLPDVIQVVRETHRKSSDDAGYVLV